MANDKNKKKGVVGNYNKQPVTKRKYYYDYNEVSNIEKGFADSFTELEAFNTKLKDELKKEKTVKLQIHNNGSDLKEGLLDKALMANDIARTKIEYRNYIKAGGEGNFQAFLKKAMDMAKDGKTLNSGADVV